MNAKRNFVWLPVLLMVFGLTACEGDDAGEGGMTENPTTQGTQATGDLRVNDVDLGSSVDADRRVISSSDNFEATDTVYVSVSTEGAGSGATLTARWTFEDGQVVDESSQTISPTGPANTEFHISMPDGLPPGEYSVEILLNGQSVETESFDVE